MKKHKLILQYLVPHHLYSRMIAWLTRCRWPWLKNYLIGLFLRTYPVDMSEAQEPDAYAYPDFNHFFVRALKPGIRPVSNNPGVLVSPVDGSVGEIGQFTTGNLAHAKGKGFDLISLLGGEQQLAEIFDAGDFATLYLAPHDYHRIHMPIAGTLSSMIHVPGQLFSVNPLVVNTIPNVFARNERVIAIFDTAIGKIALILVGAMLVASIETTWAGIITPKLRFPFQRKRVRRWDYKNENRQFQRAEEMGRFQFGSTVIMLCEKDQLTWSEALKVNEVIKLGQTIARIK